MNAILVKALIVLLLAGLFFVFLLRRFTKKQTVPYLLALIGSGFLVVVGLVHIFEAEKWFEFMHWGSPHSIGHYLDFFSALFGVLLLVIGFILNFKQKEKQF